MASSSEEGSTSASFQLKRKRDSTTTDGDDDSSEEEQPTPKAPKVDLELYSSKSWRMMKKMGFDGDKGLGKSGQGRLEPVEASTHKGRRGLGARLEGFDAAGPWDPEKEILNIPEIVTWLNSNYDDLTEITRDVLDSWLKTGERKLTIFDETTFCEPIVLKELLRAKTVFDSLSAQDMQRGRTRSNPFETIRGAMFLNRAAVKMANMDSMLDFMFTRPQPPLLHKNDLLYFADVCAGPGGFSEYVLYRRHWKAKGFGFTLRKENDFKLQDFYAGNPETFDTYYGVNGDGDVFDPANIDSLKNYVLNQTSVGVHFMMSDGGFSVEGQENIQEILSKQLYLCQCLVALSIVREGGHFVTKLFDLYTPFSVGLVYLMYKCFHQVTIIKPNTSRPANSERYLVCKSKKLDTDSIEKHLFEVNQRLNEYQSGDDDDIIELVPLEQMRADKEFFDYIVESNNRIGEAQIVGLHKIAAFCRDSNLHETRQASIRADCLKMWELPDQMRTAPLQQSTEQYFTNLMAEWNDERNFLTKNHLPLNGKTCLDNVFDDISDWYFEPIDTVENTSKNRRSFFMSKGRYDVYEYTINRHTGSWTQLQNMTVEMAPKSLVYGEVVREFRGESRQQITTYAFHIIDAIVLGGIDIRKYRLRDRIEMCQKFALAHSKPAKMIMDGLTQHAVATIRCKRLFPLANLDDFFKRLNYYVQKDSGHKRLGYNLRNNIDNDSYFVPHGLLFFKETKPNLLRRFSETNQQYYYFDRTNNHSFYLKDLQNPNEIYGSFKTSFIHIAQWKWDNVMQVADPIDIDGGTGAANTATAANLANIQKSKDLLYRNDLEEFIEEKNQKHRKNALNK